MYLDKKIMPLIDKKILLFMPLIGGGGVEKNFFFNRKLFSDEI